ncbi:putative pentatricopeptide repeat-containing protein At1g09680 isoform X2 [Cucumis sativus]|uniref:putative pentatricopeptide repeat-containing protein At1g09680 isoform X2 n=1 Tax=Cucumis sativus TaxID=3659 RepID=UPI0012F502F4|nr:putative pentatricopeptide repeat-containing protein At1g09680 isoform X2 [Cucumis sativus]KAE8650482.1 hypothetical protein Csa_009738 [Cucumis sativus]
MKLFSNHSSHGITSMPNNSSFKHSISLSKPSFLYSTWHSPPPLAALADPVLAAVSTAINNAQTKPLASSLRRLLPSFKPHHFIDLINQNPFSLSPSSLFSFFNWLSSIPTFRHTSQSYCAMANFLSAHQMFQECQSIIRFLVSRKGKDSAASVFAAILDTAGRLDVAEQLFDEMQQRGLRPNGITFTALIDGQCRSRRIDSAMNTYHQMLTMGVKPDLVMYNTLLNGLCKVGDVNKARKLVDEMRMVGMKPDKITYTTLIDGYCKEGDLESAMEIRKGMNEEGVVLDNVAFTALISGFCRDGRVRDAERTLREMVEAGMKPDDATYTMVIDGYCKKGNVKMGFKLLKEMQINGHKPGVITYNVLMNGLCKQGQMKNANMLLEAMLNLGVTPDDITYNILLEGHCKNGKAEDLLKLRNEKGLIVDYAYYTSLVSEYNKSLKDRQKR